MSLPNNRDTPISIVALNQGNAICLENLLKNVAATPRRNQLEIVLVDHGFQNATTDVIRQKGEKLFIRHIGYTHTEKVCSVTSLLEYGLSRARYPKRLVLTANVECTQQSLQTALDRVASSDDRSIYFQMDVIDSSDSLELPDDVGLNHPSTGLNVVFVTPGYPGDAQYLQAHLLARRMERNGVDCCIVSALKYNFTMKETGDELQSWSFPDGRGPDIVHAWTMLAPVRKACERLLEQHACFLVLHLEADDFENIDQNNVAETAPKLSSNTHVQNEIQTFMTKAYCLTTSDVSLHKSLINGIPVLHFAPIVNEHLHYPHPINASLREKLNIPTDHLVVSCAMDVYAWNSGGVASLYKAIDTLNKRGIATTLLHAGIDFINMELAGSSRGYIRRLGRQSDRRMAEIFAAADVIIWPGTNKLNDDASIMPEIPSCFAHGRPVVLGHSGLERSLRHGEDAFVLKTIDAEEIVRAITDIQGHGKLAELLSKQAIRFYRNVLYEPLLPNALLMFYRQCIEGVRNPA
jgi:glycosyltransferase involved in cell wall biosynthesis